MDDQTKFRREHSASSEDFFLTRRQFLNRFGMGFGGLGLATMLGNGFSNTAHAEADLSPLLPKQPHFPGKAKRVIHIFAQGAPSHLDTFDPKPDLLKFEGKSLPGMDTGVAMPSPFKFQRHGKSGIEISEVFPHLAKHADEMTVIRSMFTDIPSHEVATTFMNTGSLRLATPCLGSWAVYGLGTENQNMPGFISLRPGGGLPSGGTQNWQSAFLPGVYQGSSINTSLGSPEEMVQHIRNPYVSLQEQRRQLDLVKKLNEFHSINLQKDANLEARIQAFEIAFKMQSEATDAFNYQKEPLAIREQYGNTPQGRQLLIARRLVERGVRFVQIWAGGWDHHQDLDERLPQRAGEIDKPFAALIADLKERGLLDSTLVVWGGEFGRKPIRDRNGNDNPGRDHNNHAFTTLMLGGGVKRGHVHGATDDIGAKAVKDRVHVHDLHATILHLLGFDHTKLTYRYNGRDFRLTDVAGDVVKGVLA